MKELLVIALSVFALAACTTPPKADVVVAIQNACVVDAGIRPVVTALEVFANPQEILAINTARSVIDPICANPSASPSANVETILATNLGQIQGILVSLQARKAAAGK